MFRQLRVQVVVLAGHGEALLESWCDGEDDGVAERLERQFADVYTGRTTQTCDGAPRVDDATTKPRTTRRNGRCSIKTER